MFSQQRFQLPFQNEYSPLSLPKPGSSQWAKKLAPPPFSVLRLPLFHSTPPCCIPWIWALSLSTVVKRARFYRYCFMHVFFTHPRCISRFGEVVPAIHRILIKKTSFLMSPLLSGQARNGTMGCQSYLSSYLSSHEHCSLSQHFT